VGHRRRHVEDDGLGRRLCPVEREVEVLASPFRVLAGGPAEIVEGRRVDPGLGEAGGEIPVEGV
jgi:hypothetical protein